MVSVRQITAIPTLMRWRAEVISHVFGETPGRRLLVEIRKYYRSHIPEGAHLAFVAEMDGEECGCGSVCITEELPSPDNPTGRRACLVNIYVRREFRNRGVGRAIVSRLVDEAGKRGCGVIYLETTADGRPLYLSAGFVAMPDAMKFVK